MADGEVTAEGRRLIKAWDAAKERLRSAQRDLTSAEVDSRNTEAELAKWLLPEDAKAAEKIGVWYGDSLIQVEHGGNGGRHSVTIRKRGKEPFRR